MPREWDARTYDSLPLPHLYWGRKTLGRLTLTGAETVLDAGCGTGRDTSALLDLLPDGRVIALDGSAAMLAQLRARLADRLDRVEVIQADLLEPLPVHTPVDAVVSVAAFHWLPDHDTVFRNLAAVMRPEAQLAFECGGQGNVASIVHALDEVLPSAPRVWNFAGVDDTTRRLLDAGFTDVEVTLTPDPARFEQVEQFRTCLGTVVLGAHLDRLPHGERADFVDAVAARLPEPVVDYVRLQVRATRSGD
ncbi:MULTISPECIES: class I SAM-dependent methyltransferase [Frankia]|uniref:Trans-aconitate 2-methyltransferase n=1 Tax=Frankia alni (strain DSM 45986 / CECT 9034 / ACN14a) TaxID=326424 RepID=Q0RKD2_FRAAA|nr:MULTISPECIES: class I SAM-dependent methyltransferase [Frankia]CAJ62026.1 putative Trans-aconitate 2-methyltransferase [Frankia alni ACN14a]